MILSVNIYSSICLSVNHLPIIYLNYSTIPLTWWMLNCIFADQVAGRIIFQIIEIDLYRFSTFFYSVPVSKAIHLSIGLKEGFLYRTSLAMARRKKWKAMIPLSEGSAGVFDCQGNSRPGFKLKASILGKKAWLEAIKHNQAI